MTNDNDEPSGGSGGSLFSMPLRVERCLAGSSWAIAVKGRFIAVSPAMHDLISHASHDELQHLGKHIKAITVEPEWWNDYRLGWGGVSFTMQANAS